MKILMENWRSYLEADKLAEAPSRTARALDKVKKASGFIWQKLG